MQGVWSCPFGCRAAPDGCGNHHKYRRGEPCNLPEHRALTLESPPTRRGTEGEGPMLRARMALAVIGMACGIAMAQPEGRQRQDRDSSDAPRQRVRDGQGPMDGDREDRPAQVRERRPDGDARGEGRAQAGPRRHMRQAILRWMNAHPEEARRLIQQFHERQRERMGPGRGEGPRGGPGRSPEFGRGPRNAPPRADFGPGPQGGDRPMRRGPRGGPDTGSRGRGGDDFQGPDAGRDFRREPPQDNTGPGGGRNRFRPDRSPDGPQGGRPRDRQPMDRERGQDDTDGPAPSGGPPLPKDE